MSLDKFSIEVIETRARILREFEQSFVVKWGKDIKLRQRRFLLETGLKISGLDGRDKTARQSLELAREIIKKTVVQHGALIGTTLLFMGVPAVTAYNSVQGVRSGEEATELVNTDAFNRANPNIAK